MKAAARFGWVVLVASVTLCMAVITGCGSSATVLTSAPETYKNSALLVSVDELAAGLNDVNLVVIDVRSATDYAAGHIAKAVNLTPGTFDKGGSGVDSSDLKTPADIATILGNAGISANSRIVVYGKTVDASAGRVFWMLEYLGAKDVHILNGGYDNWVGDIRATVTTVPVPTAATFVPAVDDTKLATKAIVLANYSNRSSYAIVDSRDATDPTGTKTGTMLPYSAKHIPNAINILNGDFLNADNAVKSYDDLKALLNGKGITLDKKVITHCYVGYRSGQEYFIFRLMGYDVSNYDGSWAEWNADATLPTEP
ncbi:sulfurtransferase [Geobacter sp. SVR]|uniref:sulfurtransferase n=1 Tax=Geobacter sp. SVR TaxID=2495594 RepID=UPI00143EF6E4|nr:sulfurtransferase [Geobacter sp. SVR]BCS53246.1 sulfurtransferase [Geobacter sp. SVR]GCF84631.1 thiosulfate sulfurtransferase [Geobacter sp. SVR]